MMIRLLAPLEIVCLRWVARGKTLTDIASIEGIYLIEARAHVERAVAALDAKSTAEAIARLHSLGHDET